MEEHASAREKRGWEGERKENAKLRRDEDRTADRDYYNFAAAEKSDGSVSGRKV